MADKFAWENALYISNDMKVGKRISLQYGIRYSLFSNVALKNDTVLNYDEDYNVKDSSIYSGGFNMYNHYHGPEPRVSVKYKLNKSSSVKASYNRMRQYLHLASNSSGGTPIDVWVPSSTNILPQLADQIAVGYFKNLKHNMFETSVEVYYKWLNNQIDFKDHAQLLFNPKMEGEIRAGKANSYGLELYIHKQKGNLTGWISYTLSKTTRTVNGINDDNPYLANYDRRHNIAIVMAYDITERLNFAANWVYITGQPMTIPVGKYEYKDQLVPIYTERNGGKMPSYHRMDFALTYDFRKKKRWEHSLNLSVYNVYRRKNAFAINFLGEEANIEGTDRNVMVAKRTYLFDIVPAITYNFKF